MNDEVKRTVEDLRRGHDNQDCWKCGIPCDENRDHCTIGDAADLIETLLLVIEQKDRELAGFDFLLTSAQSAAETYKRERDAAVDDVELGVCCETCKHDNDDDEERFCHGCIRATCRGNWEWRGGRDDG